MNPHPGIQSDHQRDVQGTLAQQGQHQGLHFLLGSLEHRNHHEIHRRGRAGKADDPQEIPAVGHGFSILDKAPGNGRREKEQRDRGGAGNGQGIRQGSPDSGGHPPPVA